MIVHTEAIVFRSVDFRESSKIVTLFTREHGKVAVMVRGAKKPKNRFTGLMEVGNLLHVVYYQKNTRSVQTLTKAEYAEKNLNLRLDFEKMATSLSALELITQLLQDGEVNRPLFGFTKRFLVWLDRTEQPPRQVFPYLQLRLADLMGLGLQGGDTAEPGGTNYLNVETGYISAEAPSGDGFPLTQNQMTYVQHAMEAKSGGLFRISFGKGELKSLIRMLDRYLQYHLEGLKDRRSDAVFEQMIQE